MQLIVDDFSYALRKLRRSPLFFLAGVATFALGIALTVTVASLYTAVVLQPLPFVEPERLVTVGRTTAEQPTLGGTSPADFVLWKMYLKSFDGLVAWQRSFFTLHGARTTLFDGAQVSGDFFEVLGVTPILGRTFHLSEAKAGAPPVALISERLWRGEFAADPSIVGRTVTLSSPGTRGQQTPYEIVGVLPAAVQVRYPEPLHVFVPYVLDEVQITASSRGASGPQVWGRLKPEATIASASAEMRSVMERINNEHPSVRRWSARVDDLHRSLFGGFTPLLRTLLLAVALILVMAGVNLFSLIAAKLSQRRLEHAVRSALGAPGHRLYLQTIFEYGVMSAVGAVAGVFIADVIVHRLAGLTPLEMSRANAMAVDWPLVGAAVMLGFAAAAVGGFVLVRASAGSSPLELKGGLTLSSSRSSVTLRNTLIVVQAGFVFLLASSAALLANSVWRLIHLPLGFEAAGITTAELTMPVRWVTEAPAERVAFEGAVAANLRRTPMVRDVATSTAIPFGTNTVIAITAEGAEKPVWSSVQGIDPQWFELYRAPLTAGRAFTQFDSATSQRVAIVNEAYARTFTAGASPIGKRVRVADWHEIVGVVGDITELTDASVFRRPGLVPSRSPTVFLPNSQVSWGRMMLLSVRTSDAHAAGTVEAIVNAVSQAHADVAVGRVISMPARVRAVSANTRFYAAVLLTLGGAGLVLAIVGVFGVVLQQVTSRRRELAIRMAMGATGPRLLTAVLRSVSTWLSCGIALGVVAAWPVYGALRTLLFEVRPADPSTLMLVAVVVFGSAIVAALGAALRILKMSPRETLAAE
jgi:putative ABC transport system permease protein